jgi:PAS domain S-box-containing protein
VTVAGVPLPLLLAYPALIPVVGGLLRQRRSSERRLRAREQLSEAIVQNASQGIWVLGADGLIEFVNPRLESLLGVPAAEMIGRPIADFALAAPARRGREELLLRRGDGSYVWTLVATEELGESGGAVATVVDIEDLKGTEESLDGSRRRLAAIVHAQREIAELESDLPRALQAVVDRTRALTGAEDAVVSFLNGDELEVRATTSERVPYGSTVPADTSLSGLALATGASQSSTDTLSDDRVAACWREDGIARSCVLVPLTGVPAVLAVVSAGCNVFDDDAFETTRLMAEFASVALHNAEATQERELLVTALAVSEERFRNAIESSPIGFALCTPDDRYVVVNDAYCRIVGRHRDQLQTLTWRDLIHPDDLSSDESAATELLEGAVPHLEREQRLVRDDGRVVWVRIHVSTVRDAGGRPLYGLAQVQDITEQRRLETAVRERERLFRSVFERSLLAKLLYDDDGRILDANERTAELLGVERHELIGRHFSDFAAAEDPLDGYWREMLEHGWSEGEADIETPAGRRHVIFGAQANVQPGWHLANIQDVTEYRRLEERLRQGQKLEAVGRLAGGVAHDFNNMLTAISGYTGLLLARPELDDSLKTHVLHIEHAASRAAELTRQLLAFSRRQVLQPTVLDLNAVVESTRGMVTRLIGEHVQLETVLSQDAAPVVADESQLEQVLINLAVNARDAMPQGGKLRIETAIAAVAEGVELPVPPGVYTTLSISDTGVGMSDDQLERLFEPFYSTKGEAGVGLGLATVHGIVHQSGGHITVKSAPGSGARFTIYLPASPDSALSCGVPSRATPPALAGAGTVLLVEDEPAVRAVVGEMFEDHGYDVLSAAHGAEAVALAEAFEGTIDLLVTDVVMPGMSGQEVARRVAELRPETRTLFVSGYNDDAIHRHGVLAPGAGFLEKPFSSVELVLKARELLGGVPVG